MKRLLLVTALGSLASCQCIDASKPNRYACDPKAELSDGGNAGCPGGFRCNSVEGFCFEPDAGAAERCLTDLDCGGGWRCNSAEDRCFDPDAGAELRCASVSDCASGWRCNSRVRTCFPAGEAQGTASLCAVEDDCADGWHCGVAGLCNSLDAGAPYPCRRDGGEAAGRDCTAGWRCGLEGVCHQRSTGASYQCDPALPDEASCEQGWRCGPDYRCVDSAKDGLFVNGDAGAPSGTLAFPPLFGGEVPVGAAVSDTWVAAYGCEDQGRWKTTADTVALVTDAGLVRLVLYGRGGGSEWNQQGFAVRMDGGPLPTVAGGVKVCPPASERRYLASRVNVTPLPAGLVPTNVRDVAQVDDGQRSTTWVLGQSGAVFRVDWQPDGGSVTTPLDAGFAGARLHLGLPGSSDGLAVIGQDAVAVWAEDAGSFRRAALGAGGVIDVEVSGGPAESGKEVILHVARPRGLIDSAPLSDLSDAGAWRHGTIEPGTCPGGTDAGEVIELRETIAMGMPVLLVWTRWANTQGPKDELAMYDAPSVNDGGAFDCNRIDPLIPVASAILFANEAAWPPREVLVGRAGAPPGDPPQLAWTHPTGDGGIDLIVLPRAAVGNTNPEGTTNVGRELEPFDSRTRWFKSNPRRWLAAGPGGRLWVSAANAEGGAVGSSPSGLPLDALTPTTRPDTVFQGVAAPLLVQEAIERTTPAGLVRLVTPAVFALDEAGGYARSPWMEMWHPWGAVAGRPSWYFNLGESGSPLPGFLTADSRGLTQALPERFGFAAYSLPIAQRPVYAATAPQPDGGALLVVSMRNTLYAAGLGAASVDGLPPPASPSYQGFAELQAVDVPLLAGTISSLLALPAQPSADAGTRYALGYVVVSGRVFRYRADNSIVWRSEEVSLSSAEAVAVWADGTRSRAGFRDGTVFSLPSRAPVAPALSPSATTLVDIAGVCGHTFALATSGLYQLVATAENEAGAWRRVPLPSDATTSSYGGWRLYTDGSTRPDGGAELLLFDPRGAALRVGGFRCLVP